MSRPAAGADFRYLNADNRWPGFELENLMLAPDGVLSLAERPGLRPVRDGLPPPRVSGSSGSIAGGIAVGPGGDVFLSDPVGDRVLRWDSCDGSLHEVARLAGTGSFPGQLRNPSGLLSGLRGSLWVADTGNARVLALDDETGQIRDDRGPSATYPTAVAGWLRRPVALAADSRSRLYVLDAEGPLITRTSTTEVGAFGEPDTTFAASLGGQDPHPVDPRDIAVADLPNGSRLVVADAGDPAARPSGRLLAYRLDGTIDAELTAAFPRLQDIPTAITAVGSGLVVGFARDPRLLVIDCRTSNDLRARLVTGPDGGVAALATDDDGSVLVRPAAGGEVARLVPAVAVAPAGSFVGGPVRLAPAATVWGRVRAIAEQPGTSQLQLFTCAVDDDEVPTSPPAFAPAAGPEETPLGEWRAAPPGATDVLVRHPPARRLWIAGRLHGDGTDSPSLSQLRVAAEDEGWVRHLPGVYRRDPDSRAFLTRLLGLLATGFEDVESLIDDLPRLFDPASAPDEGPGPTWLDWLGGWLGVALDESADPRQRRAAVAGAVAASGARGTAAGLRAAIEESSGATTLIDEPGAWGALWSLGRAGRLGSTAQLAAGNPQGALVGSTAVLDQSSILPSDQVGAPALSALAGRFRASVYAADVPGPAAQARLRSLVDADRPAHVDAHLCVITPMMRIGCQARLGIDTIVAETSPLQLDEGDMLGTATAGAAMPGAARSSPHRAVAGRARLTQTETLA